MFNFDDEKALDDALTPVTTEGKPTIVGKLASEGNDLINKIVDSDDPEEVKDLSQLFSLNQRKKSLARSNRLSNLLELIDDEVISRFTENPEMIDDKYLINYMNSTQQAMSNIENSINQAPQIQINNQTNVNIDSSGLSRESRAKVLEVVSAIKNSLQTDSLDNIIDIIPKEKDSDA